MRWIARSDAARYETRLDVPCIAPRGGRCERRGGRPDLLGVGIAVLGLGYAGAALIGGLTWSPRGGEVAGFSFIPIVGPFISAHAGAEAGFDPLGVILLGLPAALGQAAGLVLTVLGATLDRTVTEDADGRAIRYAGGTRLLYAGPTGFGLAF